MQKYLSIILVLTIALIGGGTFPFTKIALYQLSAPLFIALRFITAGILMIPIFLYKKEKIDKPTLIHTFLVSLLAVSNVTFFAIGVKTSSATVASILYATVPILVALISKWLFKDKLNKEKIIGIILGFVGVSIIILSPIINGSGAGDNSLFGNLLVLVAVLSYSFYTVLSKPLQKRSSPLFITTVFIVTTIFIQSLTALLTVNDIQYVITSLSLSTSLATLYVGFLGTAVYFLLYQYTIKKASPIVTSMVFYLQPVSAFIWATILLNEKLAPEYIIGGMISFAGAYLVTKNK